MIGPHERRGESKERKVTDLSKSKTHAVIIMRKRSRAQVRVLTEGTGKLLGMRVGDKVLLFVSVSHCIAEQSPALYR